MASSKTGGEVDALCTKCKMTLAHTILAMVGTKIARVRCNTCMGEHAYRGTAAKTSKPRASRASTPKAKVLGWEEQMAGRDLSTARKYSVRESFAIDDLVNHPTFGVGIVTGTRIDKVDIAFKGESRTLVMGRAESPGAKPAFAPPGQRSSSPADKPTTEVPDTKVIGHNPEPPAHN
jgi:hypothetical protein